MSAPTESPAVVRWRERLRQDASQAVVDLLAGRAYLGPYQRALPSDALARMLPDASDRQAVDEGVVSWLESSIGQPAPAELGSKAMADALMEAFRATLTLPLPQTDAWLVAHHGPLRTWLRTFDFGRSRDPEAALLVALAHHQTDRSLLPLWVGLARLTGGAPVEHGLHALLGLRLMPADDHGTPERLVPKALIEGLLDLGEALTRRGDEGRAIWLRELDFLTAVYPLSVEGWEGTLRPLVAYRRLSAPLRGWLAERYPAALEQEEEGRPPRRGIAPPTKKELDGLLREGAAALPPIASRLRSLLDRHRAYVRDTGDSYPMVMAFCIAGEFLLTRDPSWARELGHEAARWEPQNPVTWATLARALDAEGDWRRAEAVFWHARRRFPHNVHSYGQLGHALADRGEHDLALAVLREAVRFFPGDPDCEGDIGQTLRLAGRHGEALAALRKARDVCKDNAPIAAALADTLIDLGRLADAGEALTKAQTVGKPHNREHTAKLKEIAARLRRAKEGEPIEFRPHPSPTTGRDGDLSALSDITGQDFSDAAALGRATLWRRTANGGLAQARQSLASLRASSEQVIESGLLAAVEQNWAAAVQWFDNHLPAYAGDGVLRVHRLRAHARAGQKVDWSEERARYARLLPVILVEEKLDLADAMQTTPDSQPTEEDRQDGWFSELIRIGETSLRDLAEEDFLASRHMV